VTHVSHMFDLTGKVALVTGGSRGLGLQMARGLTESGASVVIVARGRIDLNSAAAELAEGGAEVVALEHDLSDLNRMDELIDRVVAAVGDVDILLNNAAIAIPGSAEDHPVADWNTVMGLNADALFFLSQVVARRCMIPRRTGKIINIASVGALGGPAIDTPHIVSYCASKGAVISMTRALATEWGRFNINVNTIAPGYFPSEMSRATMVGAHRERVLSKTPLGRVGGDDDIKGVAVFFASEASRHVSGQCIVVDAGALTTVYPTLGGVHEAIEPT
jgi:NAD(P)-dependent dehydrogenase (short-subunit alcohol dehydrogenase family)